MTTTIDIDSPYTLHAEQIARFRRDGFIKIKEVFTKAELDRYGAEISAEVQRRNQQDTPLAERGTYGKAFIQIINLWRTNEHAREFVFGKRLARIATELMGTRGVRLYHDQALYKEAGGGYTPWHVDQFYWPLSNENSVTAWVPLDAVPLEKGPLCFAVGSQQIQENRDLAISDESEEKIGQFMKLSDFPVDETPFDLGEVSFHRGFTFHRAGPNQLEQPREVMTVIYIDSDMRVAKPRNRQQQNAWDSWFPHLEIGDPIEGEMNPLLYP